MIVFLPIGNPYKSSCVCTQRRPCFRKSNMVRSRKPDQKRPGVAFLSKVKANHRTLGAALFSAEPRARGSAMSYCRAETAIGLITIQKLSFSSGDHFSMLSLILVRGESTLLIVASVGATCRGSKKHRRTGNEQCFPIHFVLSTGRENRSNSNFFSCVFCGFSKGIRGWWVRSFEGGLRVMRAV
jgi:hypothetical protein